MTRQDLRRRAMVRRQLRARGITDRRVLAVMASVPREHFLPPALHHRAYADTPLPIGHDQTISQPYIVALMIQEARVGRRDAVLEVGTGTGYQTAVLARLVRYVWSVERLAPLSVVARERLAALGIDNVTLVIGDGALGYSVAAPYDAIIVAAAAPRPPAQLLAQLREGGRLVIPVGDEGLQHLTIFERTPTGLREHGAGPCRFVPLVSPEAFSE